MSDEKLSYAEKMFQQKYKQRFSIAKVGKDAIKRGDAKVAKARYEEYLELLALKNNCDVLELNPSHFTDDTKNAEKLLVSQVFYELSRLFDITAGEKAAMNASSYLDVFVRFTINQPYQTINTQLLQRHLKRSKFNNKDLYQSALNRIYKESKMCYIATHCFGDNHDITNDFRSFKKIIINKKSGKFFVRKYYQISPRFTLWVKKYSFFDFFITKLLLKPALTGFHKVIKNYV